MNNRVLRLLLLALLGSSLCLMAIGCAKKTISTSPAAGPVVSGTQEQNNSKQVGEQKGVHAGSEQQVQVSEYELEQEKAKKAQEEALRLEQLKQQLGERIYFDFDSYELKSESRDILKAKAELLKSHPDLKMVIEGHCDERGTEEYNLALGERRARAAYEFLILLGVDADRLTIISYGEERPLDLAHNEMAWAKNRRDEFRLVQQ